MNEPSQGEGVRRWRSAGGVRIGHARDQYKDGTRPRRPCRPPVGRRAARITSRRFRARRRSVNGKERFDVEEYCISEGWIKVPAGKTLDRKGRPLLITLKGAVEAFYR